MEKPTHRLTIHLASGKEVVTEASFPEDLDQDEVVDVVRARVAGEKGPGWRTLENVVLFSQAVPAIEVEEL